MGRHRTKTPKSDGTPPICHRIDWILRTLYANSISVMARAIGVSHTALSRVLDGQWPSSKLLEGLARLGLVNMQWLLAGGDDSSAPTSGVAAFVPIANNLLPGSPTDYPELVGPLGFPAATPLALHGAYWFRVPDGSPVTSWHGEPTQAGDYLLIETEPGWTRHRKALAGRLVVVRHPEQGAAVLARVDVDDDPFGANVYQLFWSDKLGGEPIFFFAELTREETNGQVPEMSHLGTDFISVFVDEVVGVVLQRLAFDGRA